MFLPIVMPARDFVDMIGQSCWDRFGNGLKSISLDVVAMEVQM
jgi:hypothetical protein